MIGPTSVPRPPMTTMLMMMPVCAEEAELGTDELGEVPVERAGKAADGGADRERVGLPQHDASRRGSRPRSRRPGSRAGKARRGERSSRKSPTCIGDEHASIR